MSQDICQDDAHAIGLGLEEAVIGESPSSLLAGISIVGLRNRLL
jgi:hypothetical protein